MALSSDQPRNYAHRGLEAGLPAQAVTVYAGSALTSDSDGDVGPLATGETFEGFTIRQADNSGGSAGDMDVRVLVNGVVELTVTGVSGDAQLGTAVYASDDDTFTTTASGNLQIGKVFQVTDGSNNKALVYFEGQAVRSI